MVKASQLRTRPGEYKDPQELSHESPGILQQSLSESAECTMTGWGHQGPYKQTSKTLN